MKSLAITILPFVCSGYLSAQNETPKKWEQPRLLIPGYAQNRVRRLAFNWDGKILVTDDGRTVTLWDTERGLILADPNAGRVTDATDFAAAVTPDGESLWVAFSGATSIQKQRLEVPGSKQATRFHISVGPALRLSGVNQTTLLFREAGGAVHAIAPERSSEWVEMPSGKGAVQAAAISPAADIAAVGDFDGRFRAYDIAQRKMLFEQKLPSGYVITKLRFSDDGQYVLVGANRGCITTYANGGYLITRYPNCRLESLVTVRDARTGEESYSYASDRVYSLALSRTGVLAVMRKDIVQMIDMQNRRMLYQIALPQETRARQGRVTWEDLAFSRDGKLLAETSIGPIRLIDVASGRVVRSLGDPPEMTLDASTITSRGAIRYAISRMQDIVVTEVTPEISTRILRTQSPAVGNLTWSADGDTLAADSNDRSVRVWDLNTERLVCQVSGDLNGPHIWRKIALSDDGQRMALSGPDPADADQTVEIWDTRHCQKLQDIAPEARQLPPVEWRNKPADPGALERAPHRICDITFDHGARRLAAVTFGNVLRVWDLDKARETVSIRVPVPYVQTVLETAPDGKLNPVNYVLANGASTPVKDAAATLSTGDVGVLLHFGQTLAGVFPGIGFSPDGSMIALGDTNHQMRLWSTANGALIRTLGDIPATGVRFFVDGRYEQWRGFAEFAFAPGGHTGVAAFNGALRPMLWDVQTGQKLQEFKGFGTFAGVVAFSPDGKRVVAGGVHTSNIQIWDAASGSDLLRVAAFGDGTDWLVMSDSSGFFDGSPSAYRQLSWKFSSDLWDISPMDAFFADYYRPGLLSDVMAGKSLSAPRALAAIDRRQASIVIEPAANGLVNGVVIRNPSVDLKIRITAPGPIRDLHLLRNGSLVRVWRGPLAATAGKLEVSASIPAVAGANDITAYCFNGDNVKSKDAELYLEGANNLRRKPVAYIIAAGINQYANPQFNLHYAAGDADFFAKEMAHALEQSGSYLQVVVAELLDADATKANILDALARLAGRTGQSSVPALARLAAARPEDTIAIYFAGHGWARDNRFYVIPQDLGYAGARELLPREAAAQQAVKSHGISDEELEAALEPVDAGNIMLVIDACNSGQALESTELRQGPFNSKGLAQLAWDKGLYILTAAQSYQAALETSRLQHGYLTWALIGEGLKQRRADRDPEDGQLDMREWFDYACTRVPELEREEADTKRLLVQDAGAADTKPPIRRLELQAPRAFYRRDPGIRFAIPLNPSESR